MSYFSTVTQGPAGGDPWLIEGTVTITPSGTQDVNITKINGVAVKTGTGTATDAERIVVAQDSTTVAGSASLPAGSNTIGKTDQGTGGSSAWKVDGSAVTQPVSAVQLPAALGQSGGLISQLQDAHGHNAEINVMGDLLVSQPYRLAGANFNGTTLDTNFWATTLSTGSATQTQGLVELASTAAASAYAHLASVSIARFVFAHPHRYRAVVGVPTVAVAHNTRRWGAFTVSTVTPQNGFYFELSSAGVLSIVTVSSGTPTAVASGSFNGHVSSYVVDTNLHAYEIHYFVMKVEFFIDGTLIHTVTPGTSPVTAGVYDLPIGATSINDATGGVSGLLDVYNSTILRLGREMTQPKSFYQSGTVTAQILKRGPGLLQGLAISGVGNNSNITLYDNITNSGTILFSTGAMAANTTPFNIDFGQGIPFTTGLTLNIATAASNATTRYE